MTLYNEIPWWIVLYGIKYALGRKTYVVGQTCDWIKGNTQSFDIRLISEIASGINEQKDNRDLGMSMDEENWLDLLHYIRRQQYIPTEKHHYDNIPDWIIEGSVQYCLKNQGDKPIRRWLLQNEKRLGNTLKASIVKWIHRDWKYHNFMDENEEKEWMKVWQGFAIYGPKNKSEKGDE